MTTPERNESDVQRLLRDSSTVNIKLLHSAYQDFASGTSQHSFITARMENIEKHAPAERLAGGTWLAKILMKQLRACVVESR